jgi:DNA-binding XRE family transcriptional regulator
MADLSIPRSSAIEQMPPLRQPSVSSQNANGVDMPVTPKTIGRRLLRTRQALKLSQAEFCRQIGVERNLYNPFEKGRRRITIDVAMKIRDRYGVTLDWIYAGDPRALPSGLYHQLVASAA